MTFWVSITENPDKKHAVEPHSFEPHALAKVMTILNTLWTYSEHDYVNDALNAKCKGFTVCCNYTLSKPIQSLSQLPGESSALNTGLTEGA
jgi:hypothetical protein